jgi:hypothetical protein
MAAWIAIVIILAAAALWGCLVWAISSPQRPRPKASLSDEREKKD